MSLVVAIKTPKGIVMGCDSQVSYGNNKYSLQGDSSCKIWDIINCDHGLMGSVGVLRDSQLIAAHPVVNPERITTNSIDFDYVVCELYSSICDILEAYHRISYNPIFNEEGEFVPPVLNNEFIFAYKNNAYQISQEGCVRAIDDFLVIGSGAEMATGILYNNKDKPAEERIIEAINICSANTLYIDNDISLFYTYERHCKTENCEECGMKKYCEDYNSLKEDEELEENYNEESCIEEEACQCQELMVQEEPKKENKDKKENEL